MSKRRTAGFTVDAIDKGLSAFVTGKQRKPKVAPVRRRVVQRGLLSTARTDERRTIVQHLAVDEFGELGERKREAARTSRALGHQLNAWRKRKNDQYGRWDARCTDCNAMVTVCVEEPVIFELPMTYGDAYSKKCTVGMHR